MTLDAITFSCLDDNYGVLIRDKETGVVASIDAPEAEAVIQQLEKLDWHLDLILVTHHHGDHVAGIGQLKEKYGCQVIGPKASLGRIAGLDNGVCEGDEVVVGGSLAKVLDVPGHTLDHIAFHFAEAEMAFVADAMFAMGCGRVFEGTMAQMWQSLEKIARLPAQTRLYFGHEYTESNAAFALTTFREDAAIEARYQEIKAKRVIGQATIPTTVALERATNPFLRADKAETAELLSMKGAHPADVFGELRARKDRG